MTSFQASCSLDRSHPLDSRRCILPQGSWQLVKRFISLCRFRIAAKEAFPPFNRSGRGKIPRQLLAQLCDVILRYWLQASLSLFLFSFLALSFSLLHQRQQKKRGISITGHTIKREQERRKKEGEEEMLEPSPYNFSFLADYVEINSFLFINLDDDTFLRSTPPLRNAIMRFFPHCFQKL